MTIKESELIKALNMLPHDVVSRMRMTLKIMKQYDITIDEMLNVISGISIPAKKRGK